VLDEDLVLEHGDLGEVLALADHHDAVHGLPAGKELGLAHDRGAATACLAALTATLLLGLETGRPAQRGDLVLGVPGLADPGGDGALGVIALGGLAGTTTAATTAGPGAGLLAFLGLTLAALLGLAGGLGGVGCLGVLLVAPS
jgi:hypothetical protein